MVRFLKQFFKEKETFTEKNHITEVARKWDRYFRNIPLYLSFTMTFACSSISISSTSSFTVLMIPFSLFSSLNSSYRPLSNADLQMCRSVTCNKTQIYQPGKMAYVVPKKYEIHMYIWKIHEYSRTDCKSKRDLNGY